MKIKKILFRNFIKLSILIVVVSILGLWQKTKVSAQFPLVTGDIPYISVGNNIYEYDKENKIWENVSSPPRITSKYPIWPPPSGTITDFVPPSYYLKQGEVVGYRIRYIAVDNDLWSVFWGDDINLPFLNGWTPIAFDAPGVITDVGDNCNKAPYNGICVAIGDRIYMWGDDYEKIGSQYAWRVFSSTAPGNISDLELYNDYYYAVLGNDRIYKYLLEEDKWEVYDTVDPAPDSGIITKLEFVNGQPWITIGNKIYGWTYNYQSNIWGWGLYRQGPYDASCENWNVRTNAPITDFEVTREFGPNPSIYFAVEDKVYGPEEFPLRYLICPLAPGTVTDLEIGGYLFIPGVTPSPKPTPTITPTPTTGCVCVPDEEMCGIGTCAPEEWGVKQDCFPSGCGPQFICTPDPRCSLSPTPTPTAAPTLTLTPTPIPTPTGTPPLLSEVMIDDSSTTDYSGGGTAGGVASAFGDISPLDPRRASERGWRAVFYQPVINIPSFAELAEKYKMAEATLLTPPTFDLPDIIQNKRYKTAGDYTIGSLPPYDREVSAVIFVNGSLTITSNFRNPGDLFVNPQRATQREILDARNKYLPSLTFIVKDNLNIAGGVNNIYGMYVVNGAVNTCSAGTCNERLYVFGSVAAGDKFDLDRDLDDDTVPAELFVLMPKYFLKLSPEDLLGESRYSWREIAR